MLLREPARPWVVREHRLAPWFAVATVCFGAFMGQLDASIVTLAFPASQRPVRRPGGGVQWVSLAYLLALVVLLVPVAAGSDRFGRKLVYLYGFVVFTCASAACGLAPTLAVLIALRVLQGAGGDDAGQQCRACRHQHAGAFPAGGARGAGLGAGTRPGARPGHRRAAGRHGWGGGGSSLSMSQSPWPRSLPAGTCCRVPGSRRRAAARTRSA